MVDLDVDIGADAVDYKCAHGFISRFGVLTMVLRSAIANQESLSGLETEMRKLEGIVDEIVSEYNYLKTREQRFTDTNGQFTPPNPPSPLRVLLPPPPLPFPATLYILPCTVRP